MSSGVQYQKLFSKLIRKRLLLTTELGDVYKPSVNRHKDKLIELIKEKAEIASQSTVAGKLRVLKDYWKLEMAPPTAKEDLERLRSDIDLIHKFFKTGCYKFLTVKQAWLLFLVGMEVSLWFFLGETIGKMHLVGYKVH